MELIFKYREHLKEYTVEENGYYYYMPYTYIQKLQNYCTDISEDHDCPIESWYTKLKEIERKIVSRKPKDEEKISSIW